MKSWFPLLVVGAIGGTPGGSALAEPAPSIAGEFFVPQSDADAEAVEPLTRFRGRCRMRLFVDEAGTVEIDLTCAQVSKRYPHSLDFTVEAADGRAVLRGKLGPGRSKRFSFEAAPGGYELRLDPGQNSTQVAARGARLTVPARPGETCRVIRGSRRLWFYVPEGSTGFTADLRGQGSAETAAVVVYDPAGNEVARGSTAGSDRAVVEVPVAAGRADALWSLEVVRAESGVLEDASIALSGEVAPCLAQRPQDVVVPVWETAVPGVYRRDGRTKLEMTGTLLAPPRMLADPTLSIQATAGGEEVFQSKVAGLGTGRFSAKLPEDRFPPGAYHVRLRLESDGRTIAAREHELYVIARPKNLRPDKVTLHGGKPFFARGLYHVRPEDYELVRRQGFNIVQAHPDHVPRCEEAGINAAVALYFGMRVNPDYYREKIRQCKDSPAVVAWMIMDEPAGNNVPLEAIQRSYGLIRREDPNRPAYMCICRPEAYTTYGLATDVIAIDVYPIREGREDVSRISKTLEIAQRDVPGQTVWFVGQVWSWPGRDDPARRRLVTAAEHRCMTYLALTHGNVRGLMWYSFRDPDWYLPESNPEVWAACKQVNAELAELEPVLLEPNRWEKTIACPDGVGIRAAMKVHKGAGYVIAVNPSDKPAEAVIPLEMESPPAEAEMLFESRRVPVQDGAVRDRVGPLGVHVYRTGR